MKVKEAVVGLNVDDVGAVSAFFAEHFGFEELFAADGFAALGRSDTAMTLALHRRGLEIFPESFRDQPSSGVIVAFRVEDLDAEERRLRAEGVRFLLPLTTQEWGERALLVQGPDGIVVELCDFPDGPEA
ncbi:VOC family protein [Nocardia bovistercoris]|uniref:VOC family protein n=1 Tax=Nocardia bovistercoris TaxID=2785916 RepID=A0A931IB34_9NOCA|nr:VOC family protein [Nocardia bovistercoris]MBH0777761.1 VOC family protein [Nocardia bovistercoris]